MPALMHERQRAHAHTHRLCRAHPRAYTPGTTHAPTCMCESLCVNRRAHAPFAHSHTRADTRNTHTANAHPRMDHAHISCTIKLAPVLQGALGLWSAGVRFAFALAHARACACLRSSAHAWRIHYEHVATCLRLLV
eukprot:1717020-Alexandrium_andersonii.AAC.1